MEHRRRQGFPRRLPVAVGLAAVLALLVGVAIAGLSGDGDRDGDRTYRATVDSAAQRGASAELEVSDDAATLVADGVPEQEGGEAYQVWIKRDGAEAPEPSVLFRPDDAGMAMITVPNAGDDAEAVLVTREPRSGSDAPSEDPVLTIPMA